MQETDREGSNALLVGAQGLGDGAHSSAVVSVCHEAEALLRLGKLSQAVQPEVEVLRCHACSQTLVQLTGEFMAALQIYNNTLHTAISSKHIHNLFLWSSWSVMRINITLGLPLEN